jgi:hypothetical protein
MTRAHNQLVINILLLPPSNIASNSTLKTIFESKLQPLVDSPVNSRWQVQINDPRPEYSRITSTAILTTLFNQLKPTQTTMVFIQNVNSLEPNLIYRENGLSIILVCKEIDKTTPSDKPDGDTLSSTVFRVGESIASVSKATTTGAAGVFFLGSTCSVNLGPAFIKLFQIIEILGKFYFTPIDFSSLLDYFLSKLFGLSDLIDTDDDILIDFPNHIPNNSYRKLTALKQQNYLLRANPIFVLIYPVFHLLEIILGKGRRGIVGAIAKIITKGREFIFEVSFVDFAFYSSYSMMGLYRIEFFSSWQFVTNKLLGLYYLHLCTLFTTRAVHTAWTAQVHPLPHSSRLPLSGLDPKSVEIVSEHVREDMLGNRAVRMANAMYVVCMMAFQVILTTFQNSPGPGVALLCIMAGIAFINFVRVMILYNPFKNLLDGAQRFSYEFCLAIFIGAISLRNIGFYYTYEDYVVIGMVFVCILLQVVITGKTIYIALRSLCLKKAPPIVNSAGLKPRSPKLKTTITNRPTDVKLSLSRVTRQLRRATNYAKVLEHLNEEPKSNLLENSPSQSHLSLKRVISTDSTASTPHRPFKIRSLNISVATTPYTQPFPSTMSPVRIKSLHRSTLLNLSSPERKLI